MTGKSRHSSVILVVLGLGCLLLLSLIIFSIYQQPIYIWDEAIYANNALEMANNNRYWVFTNNDVPDHYNSKPPLVLWLQSVSFGLFSYTEFALRLPTFLALLGVLFLFFLLAKKRKLPAGIFIVASFILLTTRGAIRPHVFLSGDLDGVLVFFTTALCFIHLGQNTQKEVSDTSIMLSILCLLGGYFTKSTAVLLILPSLLAGYCYAENIRSLLKNKVLYIGLCLVLCIVMSYYILRERYDPGYMQVVWDSEFTRYTSKVMSWQVQPFYFYFKNILTRFNPYYSILTLLVAMPYVLLRNRQHTRLVFHIFILCLGYLMIISIPAIKLEWYDAPVYPLWSFGLSIMLYELYASLKNKATQSVFTATTSTVVICLSACFLAWKMCVSLTATRIYEPQEEEAAALKHVDEVYHLPSYAVLMDVEENKMHHFDALHFYIKSFRLNEHKTVILKRTLVEVLPNDSLIVTQQYKIDSLQSIFSIKQIEPGFLTAYEKK